MGLIGGLLVGVKDGLTRAYTSLPVTSLRIRESSKSKGLSDSLTLAKNSLHRSAPFVFI